MAIIMKELPREDTVREMAKMYGNLDPSYLEAMIMLYKFFGDYEKAFEEHFKKYGLSDGRFHVLITIHKNSKEKKATDIANELGVSRATMTGLLDGLIKDGLIAKHDCKEDRRVSYLNLTDKGCTLLNEMLPTHCQKIAEFSSCLDKNELTAFKTCLTKLTKNLTKISD